MITTCKKLFLVALVFFCFHIPGASAVTIITKSIGGSAPANAAGGGSLDEIVNTAAHIWESAYNDDLVVTLYYGWDSLADAGTHTLQQSDASGREVSGTILFNNNGSVAFYLDPTPGVSEEYGRRTEEYQDLGNGLINVSRIFGKPSGDAAGHVDLLSVALHEIGHALGMSAANICFLRQSAQGILNVSEELPYSGSLIPLAYNNSGVIAHFDAAEVFYGSVMSGVNGDERRLPSELDVLANAQISAFSIASLNPQMTSTGAGRGRGVEVAGSGIGSLTGSRFALSSSSAR